MNLGRIAKLAGAWALGLASVTMTAGAASASTDGVQAQVDKDLAARPGGKQVGANKIVWPERGAELTIPTADSPQGSPNCESGSVCLYEDANFDGRRLRFFECGAKENLGDWDFSEKASSWHNNQTGGAVATTWYDPWWSGEQELQKLPVGSSTNMGDNSDYATAIQAC